MSNPIKVAIAGSTQRTTLCAEALRADPRFEISWILTPSPKILGRKKELTLNPLHSWATRHSIDTIQLEKKIDDQVKATIEAAQQIHFLLVVDFGYLVPAWLLKLPEKASLNIHPSLLPRWRGSSPGQFVLLYGEKDSAVTLMEMDEGLDSGPIIAQLPFSVSNNWTHQDYYHHSFDLIKQQLANLIEDFATGKLTSVLQPASSPTPIAKRLTRDDGFIEWESLTQLMLGAKEVSLNPLLSEALSAHSSPANLVTAACRAFSPWPGIWTLIDENRLKILSCHTTDHQLVLDQVQLEGKQPTSWEVIKSQLL